MGRCKKCGSFGTMELIPDESESSAGMKIRNSSKHVTTSKVWTIDQLTGEDHGRTSTGVSEFDRLIGGGLVAGQVVLIGAEPGFGKSTLCLEILGNMAAAGSTALYVSGEESAEQIGQRARRLGIRSNGLKILSTSIVEDVLAYAESVHASIVCVDSLQAMASDDVDGGIGGISQSREASFAFKSYAKNHGIPFILVSQFNKDDDVAGSNQIPHVVDTILVGDADKDTPMKFLRSRKNRYGRTGVTGVFIHEDNGFKSVSDPSKYLMGALDSNLPGAARTIISDGGKMLPVEVDALVSPEAYGNPQRRFDGVNSQRSLTRVARLMVSRPDLELDKKDVFISSANSMRIVDPSSDLALLAAVVSSSLNQSVADGTIWIGEVSLTGQVRGRSFIREKVAEASRLGFKRIICPESAADGIGRVSNGVNVETLSMVDDIVHLI
jgi:DNA repair protein RadA/Sms